MHHSPICAVLLLAGAVAGFRPFRRTAHHDDIESVIPAVVKVNTRANDANLTTKLMTAATQADRIKLLDQPGDFVYDFAPTIAPNGSNTRGKGGVAVIANAKTFPALIGNNAAMIVGFLGPCGMNTPHVHNRASELTLVAEGRLVINFVEENGVKPVSNTITRYQMTVFPQGSVHTQVNPDCTDAVFVAAFNSADPGTMSIAQNFFALRPDIVNATLGAGPKTLNGADVESFRNLIPANIALGIDTCLKRCGIKRNAKRDIGELLNAAPDDA